MALRPSLTLLRAIMIPKKIAVKTTVMTIIPAADPKNLRMVSPPSNFQNRIYNLLCEKQVILLLIKDLPLYL